MRYLIALLAVVAVGFGSLQLANAESTLPVITAEELAKMQEKGEKFVLIDSRGGKYFDGEMIKGAVNLPADKTDEKSLAAIVPDKSAKIVFYCTNHDCPASAKAAHKAIKLGYTNVVKYSGGFDEWKSKGLPTVKSQH